MWPGLPMWAGLVAVPVVIPHSRRSGRRCRMSHDVGPVHGRIDGSAFRLAHDAGPGVRVRGGARGRYWVWTQDGIVLSLCASDILTCVFG